MGLDTSIVIRYNYYIATKEHTMTKVLIKPRNLAQKAVRDPQGAFRPRVIRDKTKYTRKKKHKENY